jgi:hypothetical protein
VGADWSAIENALFAWVQTASGLASSGILWAEQSTDVNRPTGQHVSIKIGTDTPLGSAPEKRHTFVGSPVEQEVEIQVIEFRELIVSIQAFGGLTTTGTSARALAAKIQTSLGLPSVRAALDVAGLSCFDRGKIEHVSEVLDADYEARALFDARFYLADDVTERVTYVQHVEVEDTVTGKKFTVSS